MNGIIPKLSIGQIFGLIATKIHEGGEDIATVILQEWLTYNSDKPNAYIAWYELGMQLLRMEMFEAAQTAFQSALQEGRCFPAAALKLAEATNAKNEISNNQVGADSKDLTPIKAH
jgi:uncharacterized protein HemY